MVISSPYGNLQSRCVSTRLSHAHLQGFDLLMRGLVQTGVEAVNIQRSLLFLPLFQTYFCSETSVELQWKIAESRTA